MRQKKIIIKIGTVQDRKHSECHTTIELLCNPSVTHDTSCWIEINFYLFNSFLDKLLFVDKSNEYVN